MASQKTGKFLIDSIIIFFVVFVLVNIILITMQNLSKNMLPPESMAAEDVAERIKPVAQVNVGEPPVVEVAAVEAAPATTPAAAGDIDGAKIVKETCALCHNTGMMSSPKIGSADDWAPRLEKGIDTLYTNAIDGFNMMPARGGKASLSDDEVKAAVDHMLVGAK